METGQSAARPTALGAQRRVASISLSDLRTPLVENLMAILPSGHDKAFKYALYNVVAQILAAVCVGACWAAYCILDPFIVPLLWALLCGSVIHPFKDRLVSLTRQWLVIVKESSTPLTLQLGFIPFRAVDSVSESIGTRVFTWWKYILAASVCFFVTYVLYHSPPVVVGWVMYGIGLFLFRSMVWIISWINGQFVVAITVVYVGAIFHFVYGAKSRARNTTETDQGDRDNPRSSKKKDADDTPDESSRLHERTQKREKLLIRIVSAITWAIWFIFLCRCLPYSLLAILMLSIFTGLAIFVRKHSLRKSNATFHTMLVSLLGGKSVQTSRQISRKASYQTRRNSSLGLRTTPSPGNQTAKTTSNLETISSGSSISGTSDNNEVADYLTPRGVMQVDKYKRATSLSSDLIPLCVDDDDDDDTPTRHVPPPSFDEDEVDAEALLDSNKFLYGVLCACLVVQVWNRLWLVHLLPLPVIYYGVKRLCIAFGLMDYLKRHVSNPFVEFYNAPCGPSRDLFPQPVRMLFRIIYEADRKFISVFESYLDMVATIVILVAVMVVSVILLIFVATQFYAEGDHLVRVGANVMNSTVSQYPEISKFLPEGWESLTDSLVGNAYHYGRDYIKTLIRDHVAETDPNKAEEMEKQVIELWDRIYMTWNRTWNSFEPETTIPGKKNDSTEVGLEWDDIVQTTQNVSDWFDTSVVVNYAKQNYGQVQAVLESIWTVLIGNVSLAISAITSVLSVLFGGGSAIINLIIDFVVFFTALFYLLSASSSVYKPVELFNAWFPGDGKHSSYFVSAIEDSVSGVFSATLKMSAFYGMWTWLIHTLFQVNIVFVPSFFAAIFAAVPFLMPYWAVFPAVLELWLIQGQWTKALLMLLAQMAPMSLVDAQIYSEIKGGGHPYLTALAVAGGIFYFGFQGAIVGPVVLCFLFVAVKVGSSYMKEGTYLE